MNINEVINFLEWESSRRIEYLNEDLNDYDSANKIDEVINILKDDTQRIRTVDL